MKHLVTKHRTLWGIFALSIAALFASSAGANATTVTLDTIVTGPPPPAPAATPLPSPTTAAGLTVTNQSVPGSQLSPFATNADGTTTTAYFDALNAASDTVSYAYAIYDQATGATTFSVLWGSPDTYNSLLFFTASGGNGGTPGSVTPFATFTPGTTTGLNATGDGYAYLTFTISGIDSIEFVDSSTPAFEYANVAFSTGVTPTPLPGTLPLFVGGLVVMGLLGWRRKWNNASALVA